MTELHPSELHRLVADLIVLLDKAGDRILDEAEGISDLFAQVLRLPGLVVPADPGATAASPTLSSIYDDGDVRITRGVIPASFAQAPHNHGGWNVFGIVQGAALYTSYRRTDDGTRPYHAELEVSEERILLGGEVTILPEPPHDVHAVTGLAPETTTLLMARGPFDLLRQHYLPEQRCYVELPGDASSRLLWR